MLFRARAPKVSVVPLGKLIEITASPRDVSWPRQVCRAQISCSGDLVEEQLRKFVQPVVNRLNEARVSGTLSFPAYRRGTEAAEASDRRCVPP